MYRTFRAAYWTDGQGELLLTLPAHWSVPDEVLLTEALAEAERIGLDLSYGWIEVGLWTDKGIKPQSKALVPVRLITFHDRKLVTKTPGSDWQEITAENATSLLGAPMATHCSSDGKYWPENLRFAANCSTPIV